MICSHDTAHYQLPSLSSHSIINKTLDISQTKLHFKQKKQGKSNLPINCIGRCNKGSEGSFYLKKRFKEECKNNYGEVYCLCKMPDDGFRPMIQCDACAEWFHFDCIGLDPVYSVTHLLGDSS